MVCPVRWDLAISTQMLVVGRISGVASRQTENQACSPAMLTSFAMTSGVSAACPGQVFVVIPDA